MNSWSILPPYTPSLDDDEREEDKNFESTPQVATLDLQFDKRSQDLSKVVEQEDPFVVPQSKEGTATHVEQTDIP